MRQEELAGLLPWFGIVGDHPCVVRHKDGSLQHTLRFEAPDLDAATAGVLLAWSEQLNNIVKRFRGGWVVSVEHAKRRVRDYPQAQWPNAACAAADAERQQYFLDTPHYRSSSTATLVWRPLAQMQYRVGRWLTTAHRQTSPLQDDVTAFQDQVRQWHGLLAGCLQEVQGFGPQGTLTALHAPVSTSPHTLAVPDVPAFLDYALIDRDFVPGMEPALLINRKPQPAPAAQRWQDAFRAHHLRTLTITGFPNMTYPGILDGLMQLPMEFRYVRRWIALDQTEAYQIMKGQLALWEQAYLTMKQYAIEWFMPAHATKPPPDPEALRNATGIKAAMERCMTGEVSFGYCTSTVTVWDEDERVADANLLEVEQVITQRGFTCHLESLNATEAWLGSLPGECRANLRRPMLSSRNFAHGFLGGVYTGPGRDEHLDADPLMQVETVGGLLYNVVLHEDGVGHAIVIGPTGTGKTVLVSAMALQFQRYHARGARCWMIDSLEGLRPVTHAMGGDDYTLASDGTGVAFQPLRTVDDLTERQWAQSWVEGLCSDQHVQISPAQRRELADALAAVAGLQHPEHRTMSALELLVQDPVLRQVLHPYTMAGPYGRVLDQVSLPMTLSTWARFETDALLKLPQLVAPTLGVLFHQMGAGFRQRIPTLFVLDEAWKYLKSMTFRDEIEDYLRELRKLQVSLILSTQDPSEILSSEIASVIQSQCKVRIYLPNRHALDPDIAEGYRRLGLNARQIDLIATAQPHKHYLFQTKGGCRLVDLALGPVQLSILTKGVM